MPQQAEENGKTYNSFKGDVTATMDDKIKNADVDSIINSLYDTNHTG